MRLSNIFSKNITVPRLWVAATMVQLIMSEGYCGHVPSEICGMWPPKSGWTIPCCGISCAGTMRLSGRSLFSDLLSVQEVLQFLHEFSVLQLFLDILCQMEFLSRPVLIDLFK